MLVVENLAQLRGLREVVADVSLHVARGEAVALLGPNGAGKTSTFQMIVGVSRPDAGRILLDGEDITALAVYERARRGLNYLPQEPSIFTGLTIEQNIVVMLEAREPDADRRRQFTERLLRRFGLVHIRNASASKVSGGERRRCEIARLLAARPSIILLDEPFAKLDPIAIEQTRRLMGLLKQDGLGVLITDHNVRETLAIVDRAYIIDSGRIFAEGTPHEIRTNEEVRSIYLE